MLVRLPRPKTKLTTARIRPTMNRIQAMLAERPAIPVIPRTPAIKATIKNINAICSMLKPPGSGGYGCASVSRGFDLAADLLDAFADLCGAVAPDAEHRKRRDTEQRQVRRRIDGFHDSHPLI